MMLRRPSATSTPSSLQSPSPSPSSSPPMLQRLLLVLVVGLRSAPLVASQRRSVDGVPSPGNHIHVERDVVLAAGSSNRGTVVIDSAVPVTVQRYHDNFLAGQQPVTSNTAKVLVTSDCETSDATIVPVVTVSSDGSSISVDLETLAPEGEAVAADGADAFLAPSSYSAAWRWVSDFCNQFPPLTPPTADAADATAPFDDARPTKCQAGPGVADTCQNPGEFCRLETGACDEGSEGSGIRYGECADPANYQMCDARHLPVCGCDGEDYPSECAAHGAGVSVSRAGGCDPGQDATAAPPEDGASSCRTATGIGAGDACPSGHFCKLADGVCNHEDVGLAGVPYDGICAEIYDVCMDLYQPVCGCDGREYSNSCYAHSSGVSVSSSSSCFAGSYLEVEEDDGDCPDENQCRDPQGVCQNQVNCLVDPCMGDPCGGNTEREEGVACVSNYCGGCHAVCVDSDGEPVNIEPAPSTAAATAATDGTAADIVAAGGQCDVGAPCSQAGSSCATGTETCCGRTYDSFRCTCVPGGQDGGLQYACFYTDACLLPSCCTSGPPAGMPPPAEETCGNVGGLCGTGVQDDYCCSDMQGGGTYCSETGGKASATTSTTAALATDAVFTTAAIVGPGASVSAPTTIVTDPQSCDPFTPCSQEGSTCSKGTESCCGQTFPSMQCQCEDDGTGNLHYACFATDSCMVPPCCMNGPPAGTPPPSEGTCEAGELCKTGVEGDYCCFDMQGGAGTYCSLTGGKASETTSTAAAATTTRSESAGPTGSPMKGATDLPSFSPTIGPSSGPSSGPTASPNERATSTTAATAAGTSTDGSSAAAATASSGATGATAVGTTTAATSFAAIDGNFPTETPSARPSAAKSDGATPSPNWWQSAGQAEGAPNGAFGRRPLSSSSCAVAALVAAVVLAIIFPADGDGGATDLLRGLGKFAVAAAAVSSLYQSGSSSPGNVRGGRGRGGPGGPSFPARGDGRVLQAATCRYNVEVLLDACSHSVVIHAPAGRVVGVSVEDRTSERDPDDDCATDFRATLTFPTTDGMDALVLDLEANNTVEALERFDPRCMRPVVGRPFVDVTGGSLQAVPLVPTGERAESTVSLLSWTVDAASTETAASSTGNATSHGRFLLGEDWTRRALGEHASVASFSAFSIALMTNRAPVDLVDAALKAGLDEVRHARTSFDIASRLTGKEVGPGPLPPSKHEFDQDLTALVLAVAREGCVDETLSAFVAALEAEQITSVLEKGLQDSLYSNVDRDTLTFIRDELVTIAMDESNHSALAWRTLNWVCGVDPNACAAVRRNVFDESTLEMRFNQRAAAPFGEKERVLKSMKGEWNKIFNAHRLASSDLADKPVRECTCEGSGVVEVGVDQADQPLLTLVTENVLRQMSSARARHDCD